MTIAAPDEKRGAQDMTTAPDGAEQLAEHEVSRETASHGTHWSGMHGGYFSNPDVAAALLGPVEQAVRAAPPRVIADLGGGTGFILKEYLRRNPGAPAGLRLVNMDLSSEQLEQVRDARIATHQASILEFHRQSLVAQDERLLCILRSATHYAGIFGLKPILAHIRSQMLPGEYFVHQTACYRQVEDALCLNVLYEAMGSQKWFPCADVLVRLMEQAGFRVPETASAPPLPLESTTLKERYAVAPARMQAIREDLYRNFTANDVLQFPGEGFTAFLHYRIFTCVAD
ncbi:MAG: hypothetical protein ABR497_08680 [Kiritimatiellia bacterium]